MTSECFFNIPQSLLKFYTSTKPVIHQNKVLSTPTVAAIFYLGLRHYRPREAFCQHFGHV